MTNRTGLRCKIRFITSISNSSGYTVRQLHPYGRDVKTWCYESQICTQSFPQCP